jgi:exosortase
MNQTSASPEIATHVPNAGSASRLRLILAGIVLVLLWGVLFRHLSGEWSVNEQYNYGWFVPFFAAYLFWLRWQDRPGIEIPNLKFEIRKRQAIAALVVIPALLLLFPLRLFEIANPDWRPLGWLHAAIAVSVTLALIWKIGGKPWLTHFAFPIAFIFVAVPWVTPIEIAIIQGLMRVVAAVAAEMVTLFGIPTQLEGNLIRVTNGLVGINEACSGVRSLQTSLMIGLLFGELKRLSMSRRVVLVTGAIAIAMAANFCRATFLVWIAATRGLPSESQWHDVAGYAIVALVFIGTLILAALLGRGKAGLRPSQSFGNPPSAIRKPISSFLLPTSYFVMALCWIVAVELGAYGWYRLHERNFAATTRWDVRWPEATPNFRQLKITEEVRRILRFDEGHAVAWTIASSKQASPANSNKVACLLYLFRWNRGRNSVLLANLHRPDVCLPAGGWHQVADAGVRNYQVSASFALPFRHFEFSRGTPEESTQQMAHAFYCLSDDRLPTRFAAGSKSPQMVAAPSAWTRGERIRQVLEGRRHLGQQVMEVVFISSEQMPAADAESRFAELVHDVVSTDLAQEAATK